MRKQVRLTLGQADWLRRQARLLGVPESKLVREALDQYLETVPGKVRPSRG